MRSLPKWSPWEGISIDDRLVPDGVDTIRSDPGVYKIRLVDNSGKPVAIPRFCQADVSGLLYVGLAKISLQNRIRQLGTTGHDFPGDYWLLVNHGMLQESHQGHGLQYSWSAAPEREAAADWECTLITVYRLRFGEPPPFNSIVPKRCDPTGPGLSQDHHSQTLPVVS